MSSSQSAPFRRTACRSSIRIRLPVRGAGPDAMGSVSCSGGHGADPPKERRRTQATISGDGVNAIPLPCRKHMRRDREPGGASRVPLPYFQGNPLVSISPVRRSRLSEGLPYPLGATWDGLGVNFALFSANATKVELCLFEDGGRREVERIACPNTPTRSGTVTCPMRGPARSTAIACTVLTSHRPAIASTPTSC